MVYLGMYILREYVFVVELSYLGRVLVAFGPIQDGTGGGVRHARHLSPGLCDPKSLIGCLIVHGQLHQIWKDDVTLIDITPCTNVAEGEIPHLNIA